MKRLIVVLSLILCLLSSVFAGHTHPGNVYCDCEVINGLCSCDNTVVFVDTVDQGDEPITDSIITESTEPSPERDLFLSFLLLWLRVTA